MSVAYALRTLQVPHSIPRLVFAFTVCMTNLISLMRFLEFGFPLRITLFGKKKREAKKPLPWVLFLRLQSYRLLDGNDQAAVSCLSADHGYELVVAVAEGQTVYSLFFVYVNQDLIPDLLNKRALDV